MGSSVGEENTPKMEIVDTIASEGNITPSMRSWLKKNVAAFASGERACASSSSDKREKKTTLESVDNLRSLLKEFDGLTLEEKFDVIPDDMKDELILKFTQTVKDLEGEVKERKAWAQQTALQAARKLSKDITELNILRLKRFETEDLSMSKHSVSTMEWIKERENVLDKADAQIDRAVDTEKLERENAELRAEIEAYKLRASESLTACSELAKREKRSLKKHQAWEKQKTRLQEELAVERENNLEKEQLLVDIGLALKELEAKCDEERRAKDLALSQVQSEHHLKKESEAKSRKQIEMLRKKMPIHFQRHEDNLQTLKEELSKLKASNNRVSMVKECLFCMRAEVPVLFLPCAHAVLCSNCNDMSESIGETKCPNCRVQIERRIPFVDAKS